MSAALRDRMMSARVRPSANAAMQVIDSLQPYTPEEQLMGLTAAFMLLAKAAGMRPNDMFTFADNLMHDANTKRPEFLAVEQTIREELLRLT